MDGVFQIPRCYTIGDPRWAGPCSRCCLSQNEKGKNRKKEERKKKLFQPARDPVHQLSCVFRVVYNTEHAHPVTRGFGMHVSTVSPEGHGGAF